MGIFNGNKGLGVVYFTAHDHFMQLIYIPFLDIQSFIFIEIGLPFSKIRAEIKVENFFRKTYAWIEPAEVSYITNRHKAERKTAGISCLPD